MPSSMNEADLSESVRQAKNLAAQQPGGQRSSEVNYSHNNTSRISPEDLRVIRDKFPHLSDFSEEFLQSRTLEELLRIESTSLRSKDSERNRETEDKLAANKASMPTKFYDVPAGRDNRWSELHPARFLPGAACSAQKEFTSAREVIGLSSPPAVGCYDLSSVGMGGFVTNRGWLEIANMGSTKMKVSMFNLNNATRSTSNKSEGEDQDEMRDVSEYTLALRTMRVAAHFANPWNKAFVALENFMLNKEFCKEELKYDPQPGRTLCQFTDFVINENANHWRDGTCFLTTGELKSYWDSFIGARPILKASSAQQVQSGGQGKGPTAPKPQRKEKKKWPASDICHKWNVGNCNKAPGTCYNFNGMALRHVCNWRDLNVPNAQPCAQAHTRRGNH